MRRARTAGLLLLLLVAPAAGSAAACSTLRPAAPPALPPGVAVVVRPIDGDTVLVRVGRAEERVRLIGIDTPESVSQQRPVECFGPEAKHRTAELLPAGARVRLERDVESRDRYERLLAYVTRLDDGVLVNLALVAEGYAASSPFPPNVARQGELDAAQADAQASQRGLWPACGGTDAVLGGDRQPVASPP